MNENDSEHVFPLNMEGGILSPGLSKLEYFTAMAMQGLCSQIGSGYRVPRDLRSGELHSVAIDAVLVATKTLHQISQMEKAQDLKTRVNKTQE